MKKIVLMGVGSRDFHNFNVAFRNDPDTTVVAFAATQICTTDEGIYPQALAGPRYPLGIPIRPQGQLTELIHRYAVDEVVLGHTALDHDTVMRTASIVLAAGADLRLIGPDTTMLHSSKPVVAVCATRADWSRSQTSRKIAQVLLDAGLDVELIGHPMPCGDPEAIQVVGYTAVDYEPILRRAEQEADVIMWDGGNDDSPYFAPDLLVVVADPLRSGHELRYHPAELNLRMADVVVLDEVTSFEPRSLRRLIENIESVNPLASIVFGKSPPLGVPTIADVLEPIVEQARMFEPQMVLAR